MRNNLQERQHLVAGFGLIVVGIILIVIGFEGLT
jgi:hypothetical protein